MAEEQKQYPRGQIAMGSGDLMQVTNVKVDTKANAKQISTLRKPGAGVVYGVEETTVSFDAVVDEDGPERDYLKLLKNHKVSQIRIKIPGETMTVVGCVSERSLELPLDDAIKYSITFVGHLEK